LVKRQREWFNAAVPAFTALWDTILKERINGEYIQRAPKKRVLKNENKNDPKNENKNELKNEFLINVDGHVCDQA
jgi:hypothetical protein